MDGLIKETELIFKEYDLINDVEIEGKGQEILRRFATADGAKENICYFEFSTNFYLEHHIICISHTTHNAVIATFEVNIYNILLVKTRKLSSFFRYSPN